MLEWLKRLITPQADAGFPREIKGHWYCGAWYRYLSALKDEGKYHGTTLDPDDVESPAVGRVAFNPWRTGHADRHSTSNLVDGLIPAIRLGDRIGLYEQVGGKYRITTWYDGAPWDDGFHVDLRFVRSIPAEREAG